MIKLDNVNKYYNRGKANQIHVINDTTMTLPDRGIVCILGPSGCGKTTLLNAIGGLDKVNSGKISIDGEAITRSSSNRIDRIRNAHIGYIFQNYNLLDDKTVYENVAIAFRMVGVKDSEVIDNRVRYCLEKVGIDQFRNKQAGSLSGGQRQRVAIARAIVKNPDIIIADEPTGNLDSANTLEIMNIIKTISRDRLVILVTHERSIADFYSDHVAEMKDGRIVKAYSNDSSRNLDYQLENKIYLRDMPVSEKFSADKLDVKIYADESRDADIKLVIRGNNLYIDTGGMLNVVDETSNIEMVDEHYKAMDESYFDNADFDYTAFLPDDFSPKYTPIYNLINMFSSGWNTVKSFKKIRLFLMIGFVFAAMFVFYAASNVAGILEVEPVEYRSTNGNYITITDTSATDDLMNVVEGLDHVEYVLPGDTRKSISIPLDDYLQTSYATEDLTVSIALTSALTKKQLIAGRIPKDPHDVVIDKAVIETFLNDNLGKYVGLDRKREFIGRRLSIPNLEDYKICGIADTESPTLFVDESQAMYILTNADDVQDEYTSAIINTNEDDDYIKMGVVKDIELSSNEIKVVEGKKPKKVNETIVNVERKDDYAIGKTVGIRVAGKKLKVVGYYTSDNIMDDTYYVNADTITADYIKKQKNFTAYTDNVELLQTIMEREGIPSKINDVRDKQVFINQKRDMLTSAILVAGVIMLISLIEMFLMLRSSFLSRIKEVGTLRAIGLKKGDIYKMFSGEILVITLITAVPGIAIMYFVMSRIVDFIGYFDTMYIMSPAIALLSLGIIVVFNLLAGLIPVFNTMRKTPAQILARTDI